MGFGSFGNGGLSSPPSNLSALAPPFTVDRSNPKPNSNPLAHLSEPPYAVPYHSSFHNWQYSQSSASRPDLYSTLGSEVDSILTTCLPLANDNPSSASYSVSSPSSHTPPLNPSNHVAAKPYYPQFVSPVIDDDVTLNESCYDLSSTSHVAPLDGFFQVDYAQNSSGLEYMPQWGNFWNRLADGEQGKCVELDRSFCSPEINIAGSFVYKNYMKQGVLTTEGMSKCDETSAVSCRKYIDVLGGEKQIESPTTAKLNNKSSGQSSKMPIAGDTTLAESYEQGTTSIEPTTNVWNNQKPYGGLYDKCFQPLGSCMDNYISVKQSSPDLVIRPSPSIGNNSTVSITVTSKDKSSIGNVAAISSNNFGFNDFSNQEKAHLPLDCLDITSPPKLHVERSDHFFVASSSSKRESLARRPVTEDVLEYIPKAGMELQFPATNVPEGFTLAPDNVRGFTSFEDSSESLDHYNPAVDSPCWKGAPGSHFPPSEVSDSVISPHLMKKSEACNDLNLQQTRIFPHCTDDTFKVFQDNENVDLDSLLCPERLPNANFPAREHTSANAVKIGFSYPKLNTRTEGRFSYDIEKPKKDHDMPNYSKSGPNLELAHTKQLGLDKGEFIYQGEFNDDVADTGLIINDSSEAGSVPFHGMESTSCLPCSAENVNKLAKLHATESTPKMNIQSMVNAIHNISELLLFHCSKDASAVTEQDHEAIRDVIKNLDACISKKIAHMTPTRESIILQQGTSHKLPDLLKGVTAGSPPVTKEADVDLHSRLHHHEIHERKRNSSLSGKDVEKLLDVVSLRDDAAIMEDHNTVQTIKKLLEENFNGEEEKQSEALLYKNLWLEAEAALCFVSYKSRFNRMKMKMEKCKSHNVKDVAEASRSSEKLPNSKVSPELPYVAETTRTSEKLPNSIQDSPTSTTTKDVDDAEASVMTRFHILKRRGDGSNSVNTEGQQLKEAVDTGFAAKRNQWPFVGDQPEDDDNGSYCGGCNKGDKLGSYIGTSDRETTKEFRVCAAGDHLLQSGGRTRGWEVGFLPVGMRDPHQIGNMF